MLKFNLNVGKGKQKYCTGTYCYRVTTYLQRENTYLEDKKRGKTEKTSTPQNQTFYNSSDAEDDWKCLVGVPVDKECRSIRKRLQSKSPEPHSEQTVMLNNADPEVEHEPGAGQGEDDVSSSRGEAGETDDAEESDGETPSQLACKRVYPLRNRKQKNFFTYHTLGQPSIVDG